MIRFLFAILLLMSGRVMAIEETKYKVEVKNENYEIRKYSSFIVAETKVESDFEEAGSQAFRILADYIFGNNKSKTKIAMTAPVSQQALSEKIAMTAPVTQAQEGTSFLVQFTMPQSYTIETLPVPNDQRVNIREIPERRVLVYSYRGGWSENKYREELKEFLDILKKDGVVSSAQPVFARFDPPFIPWFLRRNEIWIEASGINKKVHE